MANEKLEEFYELLKELERRAAKRDLWYLVSVINAGQWFNEGKSLLDWHHEKLCHELQDLWESRAKRIKTQAYVEWPRATCKTTVVSEGFPMWVAINDPNVRICLDSATLEKASDLLASIKGKFESEYLTYLFGRLYNPRDRWSADELKLVRTASFKEPTIMASGLEASKTGRHYDLIIPDDLIGQENSQNQEQIEKAKARFRDYGSLLNPYGMLLVTGTVWGPDDIGAEIDAANAKADKRGMAKPWIISRYRDYKEGNRSLGPEFPTLLPQEKLDAEYAAQGEYLYACNYALERRNDKTCFFQWEKVQFHEYSIADLGNRFKAWNCYITVDPGKNGVNAHSDDTTITVLIVDELHNWYVMESISERLTELQTMDRVFELNDKWRPDAVGFESVFEQNTAFYNLKMKADLEGKVLPLRKLKTSKRTKEMRIRALCPVVESGKLFIREEQHNLKEQLFRYRGDGSLKHEDALDSLAYAVEMVNSAVKRDDKDFFDDPGWAKKWDVEERGPMPNPNDVTWMRAEKMQMKRRVKRVMSLRASMM